MKRGILVFASLLVAASSACAAQFFGPTPYLSAADSPFDLSGLGTTFFLEDFEDALLNTPGVMGTGAGSGPDEGTDSVDADDGLIDGFGRAGYSGVSERGCIGNRCLYGTAYLFTDADLGWYPTAVGIVWTDGTTANAEYVFSATDADGSVLGRIVVRLGDDDFRGETSEDRFLGVIHEGGISAISLAATAPSVFEFDHLQYGLFVPEPSPPVLLVFGWLLIVFMRRFAMR